ncbi:MAG TPA: hypothetical protein VLR71_10985 [Casimicrobiaceae bacterium]|nr:hypothetical protein [Casimicrobiaceae bacterium]
MPRTLSAVVVVFVLTIIAYGIAKPPQGELLSSSAVIFPAQASTSLPFDRRNSAGTAPTLSPSGFAMPQTPNGSVDAPRECAPEAGVSDACIFN